MSDRMYKMAAARAKLDMAVNKVTVLLSGSLVSETTDQVAALMPAVDVKEVVSIAERELISEYLNSAKRALHDFEEAARGA